MLPMNRCSCCSIASRTKRASSCSLLHQSTSVNCKPQQNVVKVDRVKSGKSMSINPSVGSSPVRQLTLDGWLTQPNEGTNSSMAHKDYFRKLCSFGLLFFPLLRFLTITRCFFLSINLKDWKQLWFVKKLLPRLLKSFCCVTRVFLFLLCAILVRYWYIFRALVKCEHL